MSRKFGQDVQSPESLIRSQLSQTSDSRADRGGGGGRVGPGSSSDLDAAVLGAAVPDADGMTLHTVLKQRI